MLLWTSKNFEIIIEISLAVYYNNCTTNRRINFGVDKFMSSTTSINRCTSSTHSALLPWKALHQSLWRGHPGARWQPRHYAQTATTSCGKRRNSDDSNLGAKSSLNVGATTSTLIPDVRLQRQFTSMVHRELVQKIPEERWHSWKRRVSATLSTAKRTVV